MVSTLLTVAMFAALASPAAEPGTTQRDRRAKVDRNAARALGELITVSVARHEAFDVLSSSDLRRVVELEAEKQVMGCDEASSCLAEVAGAMGARYVVFGQIAPVGDRIILTLNLFDSDLGRSSGRVVIMGATVDELFPVIDGKVDQLVASALPEPKAKAPPPAPAPDGEAGAEGDAAPAPAPPPPAPEEPRIRVLVLDLEAPEPEAVPETVVENNTTVVEGWSPDASFWLLVSGAGLGVASVGTAATGAVFGVLADEADKAARGTSFQDDAAAAVEQRNNSSLIANSMFVTAGVLAVAGAGVAAASFFFGGEEEP